LGTRPSRKGFLASKAATGTIPIVFTLAAVQIGFTTTATLAGIFGGATLAERLEELLRLVPVVATYGKPLSIVVVTVGVTYTALVIGELAPKTYRPEQPGRSPQYAVSCGRSTFVS
jgi:CBS domain containing-hemolysin-like protein